MRTRSVPLRSRSRVGVTRLQAQMRPILQAAATAVAAWYAAKLILGDRETGFAPIAALICLSAALGRQRAQAIELTGGVVLGVLIADLLVHAIGTGPPQVGLMVVLAMAAAAFVGGRALLMTEAGVSAIIIGSVAPATLGVFPVRPLEGLLGGAVALVSYALVFPPDPVLHVGRAAHAIFGSLGRTFEDISAALAAGDAPRAHHALEAARELDRDVRAFSDAMFSARETARTSPVRRSARGLLERHDETGRHLDFAVRNTRVLARDVVRYVRTNGSPVPDLAEAVADLARAIWALAVAFDEPEATDAPRELARRAAARATEAAARHADLTLTEIAGRIRSTAADLVRAAQAGENVDDRDPEAPTDELLVEPPAAGGRGMPA